MHDVFFKLDLDGVVGGENRRQIIESRIVACPVDGTAHLYANVIEVARRLQGSVGRVTAGIIIGWCLAAFDTDHGCRLISRLCSRLHSRGQHAGREQK